MESACAKWLGDGRRAVRPVCLSVVSIALLAAALVLAGGRGPAVFQAVGLVAIAALTIYQVSRAFQQMRGRGQELADAAVRTERHYTDVLRKIVQFAEQRERYAAGHSERVARLSEQIAGKMGLPEERCAKLKTAGLLHDVGMLAVPEKIIDHRGKLGVADFRIIMAHAQTGYEILEPLESLGEVISAVRYHHERMNGTGYPDGLVGEDIPIEARILAVADAYDAMTHDRPHRSGMSDAMAMAELHRCSPAGFDTDCVNALAELKNSSQFKEMLALA